MPPTTVGERLGGERLGQAGHAFEQAVAAGEQADHEPLDGPVLADDDLLDLEQGALEQAARPVGRRRHGGVLGRSCRTGAAVRAGREQRTEGQVKRTDRARRPRYPAFGRAVPFVVVRLLVVDDEVDLADARGPGPAARGLRGRRRPTTATRPSTRLGVTAYDLVCLDLNLPDVDGLEVCRRLRTDPAYAPDRDDAAPRVLMLTARDTLDDRVGGLDDGADDYLVKPFAFAELAARVRSLLRRDAGRTGAVLRVGDLALDTARHEACRGDRLLDLTAKEFALLRYFMAHAGEVLSQEHLLEHVWDEHADPFTNTVRVTVGTLRRKLADGDEDAAHRDGGRPRLPAASTPDRRERREVARAATRRPAGSRPPGGRPGRIRAAIAAAGAAARLDGLDPVPAHRPLLAGPVRAGGARGRRHLPRPSPPGSTTSRCSRRRRSRCTTCPTARRSIRRGRRRAAADVRAAWSTSARSSCCATYSFARPRPAVPRQPRRRAGSWPVGCSRPIDRITAVARDIQATDLSRRIDLGGPARRAASDLADTFDDMLGRLDDAFESQRRFIQEASHELRNPLAVIRTNLDVALADPDADRRGPAARPPRSCSALGRAHVAPGRRPAGLRPAGDAGRELEPVDVGRAWSPTRPPSSRRRPRPGASRLESRRRAGPVGRSATGSRCARRSPTCSPTRCGSRPEGTTHPRSAGRAERGRRGSGWRSRTRARASADDQRDLVFQRFWRGDGAGRREEGRSGLGLTIVRQIAESHGGRSASRPSRPAGRPSRSGCRAATQLAERSA